MKNLKNSLKNQKKSDSILKNNSITISDTQKNKFLYENISRRKERKKGL